MYPNVINGTIPAHPDTRDPQTPLGDMGDCRWPTPRPHYGNPNRAVGCRILGEHPGGGGWMVFSSRGCVHVYRVTLSGRAPGAPERPGPLFADRPPCTMPMRSSATRSGLTGTGKTEHSRPIRRIPENATGCPKGGPGPWGRGPSVGPAARQRRTAGRGDPRTGPEGAFGCRENGPRGPGKHLTSKHRINSSFPLGSAWPPLGGGLGGGNPPKRTSSKHT